MLNFLCRAIPTVFFPVLFILSPITSAFAEETWQEPVHWASVGSVNSWLDIDTSLNRGNGNRMKSAESRRKQPEYYARTLVHVAALPNLDLDAFRVLPKNEQAHRIELAQEELSLLIRWHNKQAANANGLMVNFWREKQSNVDFLGEILADLNVATGLDPANPYAWHLLGWLRAQVGDLERSEQALAAAEEALAVVPPTQLVNMRRRLSLDRAWNARHLGRPGKARRKVEEAEKWGGADFESLLLRGLIAAAEGDLDAAEKFARQVKDLGDFGQANGRSLHRNLRKMMGNHGGRMTSSWILGLTWVKLGYPEEAARAFPNWNLGERRLLPMVPFASYFWRDAGYIYYATGREDLAALAWARGNNYARYRPFFVYKAYVASVQGMAGLDEELPFYLNYDQFPGGGSRFAQALNLARTLGADREPEAEASLLARLQEDLITCLRGGEFTPQVFLTLEHVFRRSGMVPQANNCRKQAIEALEHLGYVVDVTEPGQMVKLTSRQPKDIKRTVVRDPKTGKEVVWSDDRPVQAVLDDIQNAYFADPNPETRRNLARFLIRNLHTAEGRDLLLNGNGNRPGIGSDVATMGDEDLMVLLEADRQDGVDTTARYLMDTLLDGSAAQRANSEIWALVGATLLDMGDRAAGAMALQRALEFDPDNGGLWMQLRLLEN